MITITTKKKPVSFVKNMLNCPTFYFVFVFNTQSLPSRVVRSWQRRDASRAASRRPCSASQGNEIIKGTRFRCSERQLFFRKQKSYKEELFEVLRHLHFTKTIAEISPTGVPLPSLFCLFVCFDFSNEIHSLTKTPLSINFSFKKKKKNQIRSSFS